MVQVRGVTSEALEARIRQLLPSQAGFTEELSAQNLIVPIIDMTSAAEGSATPSYLTRALSFGNITAISATTGTTVIVNTTGFYEIYGNASITDNAAGENVSFSMSDGSSSKVIWQNANYGSGGISQSVNQQIQNVIFLPSGHSLSVVCTGTYAKFIGCVRQTADINGVINNPGGFTPQ